MKLSLIHISEPTRRTPISYAVFCLKKKTNWRVKGKWRRLILFFFLWSELIFLWSEFIRVQFYFIFYSIRVDPIWDPSRTDGLDFYTCLAKMFIYPVPKISHVMMKWCRRASHLGRFTLWNNSRRRASHLGRSVSYTHLTLPTKRIV